MKNHSKNILGKHTLTLAQKKPDMAKRELANGTPPKQKPNTIKRRTRRNVAEHAYALVRQSFERIYFR